MDRSRTTACRASATAAILLAATLGSAATAADGPAWTPLFNGTDLTGWDTWLRAPQGETEPIGANRDPLHVFTVVDGAVRISGQVFGALTTKEDYGDFHLRLEQKWGTVRWPPRDQKVRDSGICYLGTGPDGAFDHSWKACLECQVQEGEIGDLYPLAGPIADVCAQEKPYHDAASDKDRTGPTYTPGAPAIIGTGKRVVRSATHEKPRGEWNVIEVVSRHGTVSHIVNGTTVLVLTNPRHVVDGKEVPLTSGRIQIQSEGAEVFYRKIEVQRLE
jgi:hypothetical protein